MYLKVDTKCHSKKSNQFPFYISDGNVNYEEFVTMLLHKKPSQEDKHAGSTHLKRKNDSSSKKSGTPKASDK